MFLYAIPSRNILKRECPDGKRSYEIFSDNELSSDSTDLKKIESGVHEMFHYDACLDRNELTGFIEKDDVLGEYADMLSQDIKPAEAKLPSIMGIINMTPDSFYAGSRYLSNDEDRIGAVLNNSDIVDIGGESTRPGSVPVPVSEEIERIKGALEIANRSGKFSISIDTMHPETIVAALDKGVDYINDVTGFRDERMIKIARDENLKCIVMHMRGTPSTMMNQTVYADAIGEVTCFLVGQARKIVGSGIDPASIMVDPGLGFSKDFETNIEILNNIDSFRTGFKLLIGHSRKSFIGKLMKNAAGDRLAGTLSTSVYLYEHGVDVIRVHDPLENRDAIRTYDFLRKQSRLP